MKKTRWNHGATFEIQVAFPRKSPNGNGNGRRGQWMCLAGPSRRPPRRISKRCMRRLVNWV